MGGDTCTRFICIICLSTVLSLAGCTMGPLGTSLENAQKFFASQGLKLQCCMSGPDIQNAYSASERNVGRFVFTEYSVLIVADVSANQTIDRVRVFRIGVGL
jgi:hypothetical protein